MATAVVVADPSSNTVGKPKPMSTPEMDCLETRLSTVKLLVHNKAQQGFREEGNENLDGVQSVLSKARRKEWSIALSDSFFGKNQKWCLSFYFEILDVTS